MINLGKYFFFLKNFNNFNKLQITKIIIFQKKEFKYEKNKLKLKKYKQIWLKFKKKKINLIKYDNFINELYIMNKIYFKKLNILNFYQNSITKIIFKNNFIKIQKLQSYFNLLNKLK